MPKHAALFASLLCAIAVTAGAADTPQAAKQRSSKEIIDSAPASAWYRPDPQNTLYMDVNGGRVVIELAPQFAPAHVANIQALAHGKFWDGLSVYRSQDNFVVQFGDPDADEAGKAKPYPAGVRQHLPAEFDRAAKGLPFTVLPDRDGWAPQVGFSGDFPAARDPKTGRAWMTHCYGTLGAGRSNEPDSSNGAELYVVTGQAPRQLDLNITTVGRVLKGMQYLSAIHRGPDPMGMFDKPGMRVPITAIHLASDVPPEQREAIEVLRSDSPQFAEMIENRRNRQDGWYVHKAGHIDICNIGPIVRGIPQR